MANTPQSNPSLNPDRRPFLVRPEPGETADEFADRLIALMGMEDDEDGEE